MTAIRLVDIACDQCNTTLYSQVLWRSRDEQEARDGARALGWTSEPPRWPGMQFLDYCPSCKEAE